MTQASAAYRAIEAGLKLQAAGYAALAALEAKEPEKEILTREEAVVLTGEPSADTFYRHGIWESARVFPLRKRPMYYRKKLLALMTRHAVKSSSR